MKSKFYFFVACAFLLIGSTGPFFLNSTLTVDGLNILPDGTTQTRLTCNNVANCDWKTSGGVVVVNINSTGETITGAALQLTSSSLQLDSASPLTVANTKNKGTITMSLGTGTATVTATTICTCSDTAATPVVVRCAVSGTTLTASEVTGTSTHTIAYLCF